MIGQSRTRWMMLFFVVLSYAADGARARAHTAHSGGDCSYPDMVWHDKGFEDEDIVHNNFDVELSGNFSDR